MTDNVIDGFVEDPRTGLLVPIVGGKNAPVEEEADVAAPKSDPAPEVETETTEAEEALAIPDVHNDGEFDGSYGRMQTVDVIPLDEVIAQEQEERAKKIAQYEVMDVGIPVSSEE